ncbi:sulfite exporter TauE/SafE family protein [Chitinophaga sp.]|uniref:sulfite exporter TauE/SafE family protein n=1 Tax=Chitinophaga sp. TaxID=1869181 RepID=UPI0031DB71BA
MHLFGYFASLLIGVSLGLIGGGGSILTLPVMVYLFGVSPVMATSYSLFIVGSTSLIGAAQQYKRGAVNIRMGVLFAISSVITVFVTRKWLVPLIPETITTFQGFTLTGSRLTMMLFALLMLISSTFMLRKKTGHMDTDNSHHSVNFSKLVLFGISIGLVTGLLGAGGGFLLIPALVLILHLSMKEAIGTSLLVIALNSLIGFLGNLHEKGIDWTLLMMVSTLAIVGIIVGSYLNSKLPADKLKKGFGWFVLVMGIYILAKESGARI